MSGDKGFMDIHHNIIRLWIYCHSDQFKRETIALIVIVFLYFRYNYINQRTLYRIRSLFSMSNSIVKTKHQSRYHIASEFYKLKY